MRGRGCGIGVLLVAAAVAVGAVPVATPAWAGGRRAPKKWDARVLPYVRFVEKHRKLEFEHPVRTRFLSDEAFEKTIRADEEDLTDEDRALDKQLAGELRAMGLTAAPFDLTQASADLGATSTVGFYDSETEELVVRSTGLDTVDAKVTLVHELTHAVQDQHFDLDRLDAHTKDSSESFALDALVEGDATVVESQYVRSLGQAQQDEYYGVGDGATPTPDVALPDGVPYALDVIQGAPYALGEPFVHALDPKGGTKGRDRAFHDPPKTEELLIDPVALRHHEPAERVPAPKLAAGEKKAYDPEQFGVVSLYLMLATRLDPRTALEAVTGWGGDRYVGYTKAGQPCLRLNVSGDTKKDTRQLEAALTAWKATMPAGAADVSRRRDIVTVDACAVDGVTEPSMATFDTAFYNVLASRVGVVLDLEGSVETLADARCVGDAVDTDPDVVGLYDTLFSEHRGPTDEEQALVDQAYERSFRSCGYVPADR